jgi:hypothetical protein
MDHPETDFQAMKRLDAQVERDRKITDRLFIAAMGALFVGFGLLFFLLHLLLRQP